MPKTCPHCPDGHANPRGKPWGVYVAADRNGDGGPARLHVAPSDGSHVAESDAEWLWNLIRGEAQSSSDAVNEILAPLQAQIGVAEFEMGEALRRRREAEAAIARVREIHRPVPCENARHDGGNGRHCAVCEYDDASGNVWPCPTIRATHLKVADRG